MKAGTVGVVGVEGGSAPGAPGMLPFMDCAMTWASSVSRRACAVAPTGFETLPGPFWKPLATLFIILLLIFPAILLVKLLVKLLDCPLGRLLESPLDRLLGILGESPLDILLVRTPGILVTKPLGLLMVVVFILLDKLLVKWLLWDIWLLWEMWLL